MEVETMTELAIFAAVGIGLYFLINGLGPAPPQPAAVVSITGATDVAPNPKYPDLSFFTLLKYMNVSGTTTGPDWNGLSHSSFVLTTSGQGLYLHIPFPNTVWVWSRKVLMLDSLSAGGKDVMEAFWAAEALKKAWGPAVTNNMFGNYDWFMMGDTQVLFPYTN